MDSAEVAHGLEELKKLAAAAQSPIGVVDESLGSVLALIAHAIGADATPDTDLGLASIRLLMLSDALSRQAGTVESSAHYVVAMAFEQAAFVASTLFPGERAAYPLDDDVWLRLCLAVLHYLAGNYRVQSYASFQRLRQLAQGHDVYVDANVALLKLLDPAAAATARPRWRNIFLSDTAPHGAVEAHLARLAQSVRRQRVMMLEQLGADNAAAWLGLRGIDSSAAVDFWRLYVDSLRNRGIVAFSKEQVGDGFEHWLHTTHDMLAVLPTGAGKSIVGELKTALALAQGQPVLWLLPTRALVRQTQRQMRRAFRSMAVDVRELPVTEDPSPLFSDDAVDRRMVACTTPERANALFRAAPDAMADIGLIVFDEAQLLVAPGRGAVSERIVTDLRAQTQCDCVFLTAFDDAFAPLHALLASSGRTPDVLRAPSRPSRRVYGILSRRDHPRRHVEAMIYPPQRTAVTAQSPKFSLSLHSRSAGTSPLGAAMKFAQAATAGALRTVVFVSRKDSTEKHAREFKTAASGPYVGHAVPARLLPRLAYELGRTSVLEESMPNGALPHHAGLARLEQHLAEQFLLEGYAGTVIATPTLAQGVNLPFDISIVTFLGRFNQDENATEDIEPSELHNMLGRAGRAGMVPDGICLIAIDRRLQSYTSILQSHRRWIYPQAQLGQRSGVIQLLEKLDYALSRNANWLADLDIIEWSDSQSILAFAATFVLEHQRTPIEQLDRFPSFAALPVAEKRRLAVPMEQLVTSLRAENSESVLHLIAKSGLPPEYVQHVVAMVSTRSLDDLLNVDWWDSIVRDALSWPKAWCASLRLGQPVPSYFKALDAWRKGRNAASVESSWVTSQRPVAHRVKSGQYFNSSVGQAAQFWAIAPIALEGVGHGEVVSDEIKGMSAFVRDGVPSVDALIWLRALGGLDRVLASKLADVVQFNADVSSRERIRTAEEMLVPDSELWPQLGADEAAALQALVYEDEIVRNSR